MKRKIFSILFALVLVLSFSLVGAVPVAAAETLTVRPITLNDDGAGSAAWTTESHAGEQSVLLSVTSGADGDPYAEVYIIPVGITVSELDPANTSFWCKSVVGDWTPYFIFETDEGHSFNTDAASSAGYGDWTKYVASDTPQWQWSEGWGSWEDIEAAYGTETINCVIVESPGADVASDPPFTSYVDDITVSGVTYELEEPDHYTIQDAITAAGSGDTINVAAGTYNENLVITDKSLTLSGENKNTTIIDGGGSGYVITITSTTIGDVTISGFTIRNGERGISAMLEQASAATLNISDNIIHNFDTRGIDISSDMPGVAVNAIVDINEIYDVSCRGISLAFMPATITGNNIHDITVGAEAHVVGIMLKAPKGTVTVSGNTIKEIDYKLPVNAGGIFFFGRVEAYGFPEGDYGSVTIQENPINTGSEAPGISIHAAKEGRHDISIIGNTVSGSTTVYAGIMAFPQFGYPEPYYPSHIVSITHNIVTQNTNGIKLWGTAVDSFHHNKIYSNSQYGIINPHPGQFDVWIVDATNNWWGDARGPSHGSVEAGDAVSENVDFFPWALDEGCTQFTSEATDVIVVDDAWESYSDYTQVTVDGTYYYIGVNAFATIQDGVNAVDPGGTVNVAAGIYEEEDIWGTIRITDKSLTLLGAQADVPIVDGERDGDESIIRGNAIRTVRIQHSEVVINGFTIENVRSGKDIIDISGSPEGISDIRISYNYIQNGSDGIFRPNSAIDVTIDHNYIASNVRGILTNGGATTITDNTFYGNGQGIALWGGDPYDKYFPDYDQPNYPTIISGNAFTNDSTSISLKLGKCHQSITITGNDITEARTVAIRTSTTYYVDLVNPGIHHNNIWNNEFGIINTVDEINLNAKLNWWGSANGPIHTSNTFNVGNQGSLVSDNVDFVPWCDTDKTGTSFAPVKNTTDDTLFSSIQAAIDASTTANGETITAVTGNYKEDLNINKQLTLTGRNLDDTANAWTVGTAGTSSGPTIIWDGVNNNFININEANVTIQGFNVDASTFTGMNAGIYWTGNRDSTTIQYCTLNADDGDRLINLADGAVATQFTITYNAFTISSGWGNWFGTGVNGGCNDNSGNANVLSYNSVVGQLTSWLDLGTNNVEDITWFNNDMDYGIVLNETSEQSTGKYGDLVVETNTWAGDPSTSAFEVLASVENADWEGGACNTADVTIRYNDFSGYSDDKTVRIVNTPTDPLNAEDNWWGTLIGSEIRKMVSDYVDYSPWLDGPGGDSTNLDVTTISLASGWNLISLPLIPEDPTIATVLDGVDVEKVAGYSPFQEWKNYTPSVTSNLEQMNDGWGYWVDMGTTAAILTISGYEVGPPPPPPAVPPEYHLVKGWNLIGFKSLSPIAVEVYLDELSDIMRAMYGYDTTSDAWIVIQTGTDLVPGKGYWLAVSAEGTIYP